MSKNLRTVLVDANNFFVSCERLFRPDLAVRPVVVLSSNDGCVVSRSQEAKALGIRMGVPYFQIRELCERFAVTAFSSNFDLYRDLSRRVMSVVRGYGDTVEVYSVDEAFLDVSIANRDAEQYVRALREDVMRTVGIPVSVGVAPTKTLAKIATHLAKPSFGGSGTTVLLSEQDRAAALKQVAIEDVWGIGFRLAPKLRAFGIVDAAGLASSDDTWIRRHLSVCGVRTAYELRGRRCFAVGEDATLRKSLLHSQSFGTAVTDLSLLRAAVSFHARKVSEILRKEQAAGREIGVMIRTGRHTAQPYRAYESDVLVHHTSDTFEVVRTALAVLDRIYRPGIRYAKAGVLVRDIVDRRALPRTDMFDRVLDERRALFSALDGLRERLGDRVWLGSERPGMSEHESWQARHDRLSPRYTTSWTDLPAVVHRHRSASPLSDRGA